VRVTEKSIKIRSRKKNKINKKSGKTNTIGIETLSIYTRLSISCSLQQNGL
jgi:hypothetical protein